MTPTQRNRLSRVETKATETGAGCRMTRGAEMELVERILAEGPHPTEEQMAAYDQELRARPLDPAWLTPGFDLTTLRDPDDMIAVLTRGD